MSGMYNPLVFYSATILIILFAILTIKFKNIFYSLISAIIVFFLVGLVFYILGSEYNAVIQIAIYGVAIPIILGLAIMFTNQKKEDKLQTSNPNFKYWIFLTGGLFLLIIFNFILVTDFNTNNNIENSSIQVLTAISNGLFTNYILAFEIIAIILTIAVVGIALLNKEGK